MSYDDFIDRLAHYPSIAAKRGNEQPLRDMLTEVVCIAGPQCERPPPDSA